MENVPISHRKIPPDCLLFSSIQKTQLFYKLFLIFDSIVHSRWIFPFSALTRTENKRSLYSLRFPWNSPIVWISRHKVCTVLSDKQTLYLKQWTSSINSWYILKFSIVPLKGDIVTIFAFMRKISYKITLMADKILHVHSIGSFELNCI